MATQEVGIVTYKDGSAWDVLLLNLSDEDEVEVCAFLMRMRHRIDIFFVDDEGNDSVMFSIVPSEPIAQWIRRWAKSKGYKFDMTEESSK